MREPFFLTRTSLALFRIIINLLRNINLEKKVSVMLKYVSNINIKNWWERKSI